MSSTQYKSGPRLTRLEQKRFEAFERSVKASSYATPHAFKVLRVEGKTVVRCDNENCDQTWDLYHQWTPPESQCPWVPKGNATVPESVPQGRTANGKKRRNKTKDRKNANNRDSKETAQVIST